MLDHYLKAMGITKWRKRSASVLFGHYRGMSESTGWLLLAESSQPSPAHMALIGAIGRVLGITNVAYLPKLEQDFAQEDVVMRVLLLGESLVACLGVGKKNQVRGLPCLSCASPEKLLSDPGLKAVLWQQLQDRL